ncbi:hypothetical protein ACKKBG_A07550 [Auxenochlorella protothecoides x Auxenochlorella symbiontica]
MPIEDAAAAAREGNMDFIYHLNTEQLHAVVHKFDEDNRTLLHVVACTGDLDLVQYILDSGGKELIDHADDEGWTALHSATSCGYPSVAKLLLITGASAGQTTAQGRSPLHYAASKGCVDIIPDLVSHGADVNARDCTGATPLHRAASVGLTPVLRVLLDTPDVKLDVKDNYGQTPLSLACSGGHRVAALVLAGRGADVESENQEGETPLSLAAPFGSLRFHLGQLAKGEKTLDDFELA